MEMTITEVLDKTDWKELAEQKRLLVELIWNQPKTGDTHPLEGLLNWIDALQDAAEEAGYPVVFLTEGNDD